MSNVDDSPHPEHPIELPDGDEGEPVDPPDTGGAGELSFWERLVEGFNWDAETVGSPDSHVDIYVTVPGGDTLRVRTVPNTGSSYVTFPGDFEGDRRITVVGGEGAATGELTVPQHE
jgi:hypothetical protein